MKKENDNISNIFFIILVVFVDLIGILILKQIFQKLNFPFINFFLSIFSYGFLIYVFLNFNNLNNKIRLFINKVSKRYRFIFKKKNFLKWLLLLITTLFYIQIIFFSDTKIVAEKLNSENTNSNKIIIKSISPAEGIQGDKIKIEGIGFKDEIDPNLIEKKVVFSKKEFEVLQWNNKEIFAEIPVESAIGKRDLHVEIKFNQDGNIVNLKSNNVKFNRQDPSKSNFIQWLRTIKNKLIKKNKYVDH